MGGTILVIDDLKNWHEIIEFIFRDEGYEVLGAESRGQARKLLESADVSIVMVNLNLTQDFSVPDGTGYLMLEELEQRWPDLPRIALSAVEDPDKVVELYDRYRVTHVAIKGAEDFASRLVHAVNVIIRRPKLLFLLLVDDRKKLIEQLSALPSWKTGQHKERFGILLAAGLPEDYVKGWTLDGNPDGTAALVVNDLELKGPVVSAPDYHALGLLVKYLYENCCELEGKRFLAQIAIRYSMSADQVWLDSLVK